MTDNRLELAETAEAEGDLCLAERRLDDALKHYIASIEHFMAAAAASHLEPSAKQQIRRRLPTLIARAESVKKATKGKETRLSGIFESTSVSAKEKAILLRASKVSGCILPPATSTHIALRLDTKERIEQADLKPPLTENMVRNGCRWAGMDDRTDITNEIGDAKVVYQIQADVTNCSFVASVCVACAWEYRHKRALISNILVEPINQDELCSALHKRYLICLLYINGCYRQVVIDDELLLSASGEIAYMHSLYAPETTWPAYLEKSYMKVMGGYDFPGSNSASDIFMLTQWIPEFQHFSKSHYLLDKLWKRLAQGWTDGTLLLTLGTKELSKAATNLLPKHNYAVLDIFEHDNNRLLCVRNPWKTGGTLMTQIDCDASILLAREATLPLAMRDSENTFWISWDDTCTKFSMVYLNWSPLMFKYRIDHQFKESSENMASVIHDIKFGDSPQFALRNCSKEVGGSMWVLLQKHIDSRPTEKSYSALVYFPSTSSERVYLPYEPMAKTDLTYAPFVLLQTELSPGEESTVVILSSHLDGPNTFTITLFSQIPCSISACEDTLPYSFRTTCTFDPHRLMCGESASRVEQCLQWHISVAPKEQTQSTSLRLIFLIQTEPTCMVSATLIASNGGRVSVLSPVAADSGASQPGFAGICTTISNDQAYTLVFSPAHARQYDTDGDCKLNAVYDISIRSDAELAAYQIPPSWAGKSVQHIEGEWSALRKYELEIHSLSSVTISLMSILPARDEDGEIVQLVLCSRNGEKTHTTDPVNTSKYPATLQLDLEAGLYELQIILPHRTWTSPSPDGRYLIELVSDIRCDCREVA